MKDTDGNTSGKIWTVAICSVLCAAFAGTAWMAAIGKSPTADEPGHAEVGWFMFWQRDFRLWDNNPPLWEDWIALPAGSDAIGVDQASDPYRNIRPGVFQPFWSRIDLPRLMTGGRLMCLILGVGLGALVARWAWELGGLVPAVAATALYCLDPNFLGHAPLIKNDVALALFYLATAYALWRAGQRLTWATAVMIAVLTAVTLEVKFSGPLLAPALALVLGYRALSAEPWLIMGRLVGRRLFKLAAAGGVCLVTVAVSYAVMWASYGFRFDAGPGGLGLSMTPLVRSIGVFALNKELHRNPTAAELASWHAPWVTRAVVGAEEHHLVPQAWAAGILFTQLVDQGEYDAYLLGRPYQGGTWSYFPLAALFKEPLATIGATLVGLWIGARAMWRGQFASPSARWAAVALGVPPAVYAIAIMTSEINIGIRHAFPIHPFVFIAVGVAMERLSNAAGGKLLIGFLAAALLAETAMAFPNYIAFFNAASARRRAQLLSDSNLDWGQDLPLLVAWQREHPEATLYADFFGSVNPRDAGLRFIDVHTRTPAAPLRPGVLAISVSRLQMNSYNKTALDELGVLPGRPPDEVLGGTIYLFGVNPH